MVDAGAVQLSSGALWIEWKCALLARSEAVLTVPLGPLCLRGGFVVVWRLGHPPDPLTVVPRLRLRSL